MSQLSLPFPTLTDALLWIIRRGDRAFKALQSGQPFTPEMDGRIIEPGSAKKKPRAEITGEFKVAMDWANQKASWDGAELYDYLALLSRNQIDPQLRDRVLPKLEKLETPEMRSSFWKHMLSVCPHLADAVVAEWVYKSPPVMDLWPNPPEWPSLDLVEVAYRAHVEAFAFQASLLECSPTFDGPHHHLAHSFLEVFEPFLWFVHEHARLALATKPEFDRQLDELEEELTSFPMRPLFDVGSKLAAWRRFRRALEAIHVKGVPVGAAVPRLVDEQATGTWEWKWVQVPVRVPLPTRHSDGDVQQEAVNTSGSAAPQPTTGEDQPNEKGYVTTPADDSAYVPFSDAFSKHLPLSWKGSKKQARKLIDVRSVRKWYRRTNKLSVHLGDWIRFMERHPDGPKPLSERGWCDNPAEIESRKAQVRARKTQREVPGKFPERLPNAEESDDSGQGN